MLKIGGFVVVIGAVLGGFLLSGGNIAALWHPFEILIIGGAAFGAFLVANSGAVVKKAMSAGPAILFGHRFNKAFYLDVLGVLYEVLNKSRREGMMAIEVDVESPAESPIFSKYPAILKDTHMTEFICDYLRIMSSGNMAPHELEALFDVEISALSEELQEPSHAVTRVADTDDERVFRRPLPDRQHRQIDEAVQRRIVIDEAGHLASGRLGDGGDDGAMPAGTDDDDGGRHSLRRR